jgi:threonyl-tRNA synthetase
VLKEKEVEVGRAPFGWYKSFKISCKGHPLSELSRDFEGKEAAPERKGEEQFLILLPDGTELSPTEYEQGTECFMIMMQKEALKKEWPLTGEVKYLRLCKKFGIQWESMSDVGHMCFSPKGALMFDLCADYSWQIVNSMGLAVYTVKGTNMFSLDEGPVAEHAKLFGDRLYMIEGEKKDFVMRYAACHQQFAMMRHWTISYKSLPYGAFEVADSYRLEQSGETMLCFRTRRLNMPDLHVICRDIPESEGWFERLDARIYEEAEKLGRDYEMLVNLSSREAYEMHKPMLMRLMKAHNKPMLIHFYPEGINYYWTVNIEYHILDDMKRAREIGTVQIDIGNAKRFGITYTDENGKKQYPIILHTAVIGTIERYLYTLFDTAVREESQGRLGTLPTWVNPEQVRIMTVSETHLPRARELVERLQRQRIRVGLDDRGETVGK